MIGVRHNAATVVPPYGDSGELAMLKYTDNGDSTFSITGELAEKLSASGKMVIVAGTSGFAPIGSDVDGRTIKANVNVGFEATPDDLLRLASEDDLLRWHDPASNGGKDSDKSLPAATMALRYLIKYREESGNADALPIDAYNARQTATAQRHAAKTAPAPGAKAKPVSRARPIV